MTRTERLYQIDRLLRQRRWVSTAFLLAELEVSPATLKRDLEYLRDRLNAPIVWDREARGYCLSAPPAVGPAYELPGLWLTAAELYALLAAQKLLADLEPGLIADRLAPLQARLHKLLADSGHAPDQLTRRVRLLSLARREVAPRCFAQVVGALLERRRLRVTAWNRGRDEVNTREVSPQRLVHYRDNWYLDAWCHWRGALRSFALDTVQALETLPEPALEREEAELDDHYAAAYGIFAGAPKAVAVLRFSPERARWVRAEHWHRHQQGEPLPDGSYRLTVPYADERELLMDILRHGRHVEVEAPEALRARVAAEVCAMAAQYAAPGAGGD